MRRTLQLQHVPSLQVRAEEASSNLREAVFLETADPHEIAHREVPA